MDVAAALEELGGVASRAALLRICSRAEVDHALSVDVIVVVGRGRYTLPSVDAAVATAHALSGVLSLTSAALHHGWAVKTVPDRPHVTVPRRRKVAADRREAVHLHFHDLDDTDGVATSKPVTLLHCLRLLDFDEALAIADSTLRAGDQAALRQAAALARGPGSPQVRRVAELARPEAANPFESVLRAITFDVRGLNVEPQVLITSTTRAVDPTWSTATSGWCWKPTRSPGTATGQPSPETRAATTSWSPTAGSSSGSRGRT